MESIDVDVSLRPASAGSGAGRRQRSDAKRNVVALLDAAKSVFAATGVDAPAKQITDLAGVGVGTLYRHFPRRSDLILAVMQHEIDACAAAAATLGAEHNPWDALTAWIGRYTELVGTKHGLAIALHAGNSGFDDLPRYVLDHLQPALDGLLKAARDDGRLRTDVAAGDVLFTVGLLCQPVHGQGPDFTERMVGVFVDGLRLP